MRKLSGTEYYNKMMGCWLGKAIGGTLGAPFEGYRFVKDLEYYTMDLKDGMLPNDDLDLQLVWLGAAERFGKELTAEKLADYWLLGILPHWAEYGVAKANMRAGLLPPVSGLHNNRFKDSNGAWIRSEIWACLAPGHPEIAVKYAYEDAVTDHADEGVYSEIFFAALESAAFVESDKFKLIDIGLSFIPKDSATALAVNKLIELYRSGIDWKGARYELQKTFPGSFGEQLGKPEEGIVNGNWGFDAPNNTVFTLIGWLYAEDDFGKAVCISAGCGEDTDCTAGTVAAILGIIMGADAIPEKWRAPIGEKIVTKCVSTFAHAIRVPKTLGELGERVSNLMPTFMNKYVHILSPDAELIDVFEGDELYEKPTRAMNDTNGWDYRHFADEKRSGYIHRASSALFDCSIDATEGIELECGRPLPLKLRVDSNSGFYGMPLYLKVRFITPDGISIEGGAEHVIFANQLHCSNGRAEKIFYVYSESINDPMPRIVCEITCGAIASKIYIPVTLLKK